MRKCGRPSTRPAGIGPATERPVLPSARTCTALFRRVTCKGFQFLKALREYPGDAPGRGIAGLDPDHLWRRSMDRARFRKSSSLPTIMKSSRRANVHISVSAAPRIPNSPIGELPGRSTAQSEIRHRLKFSSKSSLTRPNRPHTDAPVPDTRVLAYRATPIKYDLCSHIWEPLHGKRADPRREGALFRSD